MYPIFLTVTMYRRETRFWGWKLSKKVLRLQRFSETLAEFKALVGVKHGPHACHVRAKVGYLTLNFPRRQWTYVIGSAPSVIGSARDCEFLLSYSTGPNVHFGVYSNENH